MLIGSQQDQQIPILHVASTEAGLRAWMYWPSLTFPALRSGRWTGTTAACWKQEAGVCVLGLEDRSSCVFNHVLTRL
jgi:hypothetical protein